MELVRPTRPSCNAIERLGVSPLHRLSFQSAAYQQLKLG
jgi:hypothetical protein